MTYMVKKILLSDLIIIIFVLTVFDLYKNICK